MDDVPTHWVDDGNGSLNREPVGVADAFHPEDDADFEPATAPEALLQERLAGARAALSAYKELQEAIRQLVNALQLSLIEIEHGEAIRSAIAAGQAKAVTTVPLMDAKARVEAELQRRGPAVKLEPYRRRTMPDADIEETPTPAPCTDAACETFGGANPTCPECEPPCKAKHCNAEPGACDPDARGRFDPECCQADAH